VFFDRHDADIAKAALSRSGAPKGVMIHVAYRHPFVQMWGSMGGALVRGQAPDLIGLEGRSYIGASVGAHLLVAMVESLAFSTAIRSRQDYRNIVTSSYMSRLGRCDDAIVIANRWLWAVLMRLNPPSPLYAPPRTVNVKDPAVKPSITSRCVRNLSNQVASNCLFQGDYLRAWPIVCGEEFGDCRPFWVSGAPRPNCEEGGPLVWRQVAPTTVACAKGKRWTGRIPTIGD
jgi:hypothetical protein